MDFSFSPADQAFRKDVQDFIAEAYDDDMRREMKQSGNGYISKEAQIRWQKRLHKRGWMVPNWPTEYGGTNWSPTEKYIYETEMGAAGAPGVLPFGAKMVAPVIMKFGTQEQKDRFLPDILESNVWWCQGYSEPGSGSDLASLQMKCVDKGDHFLCNGTKIWTSAAQHADWIFCLVRTSNEGKPQEGISFILIDMTTPGIKVEPIVTIDNPPPGAQEVNQVFFDDVKVPKENLIGEVNKGWTYAKYLLEFERGNAYSSRLKGSLNKIKTVAKTAKSAGMALQDDHDFRRKVAEAEIQVSSLEMTELRILSRLASGQNMGPESSLMKCRGTELQQLMTELTLEAAGVEAQPHVTFEHGQNEPPLTADFAALSAPRYFNNRKVSIYAGSNEIQRNIMAKLILGL